MDTGFWYRETRPPFLKYDTVPYANLTVKIKRPVQEGPGQNLMTDPEDPTKTLYTGNTINRQSFDSQFVLDLAFALKGISVHRIYVMYVYAGNVHFSWETSSVIVNFLFLERNNTLDGQMTLLEAVQGSSFFYLVSVLADHHFLNIC